MIGLLGKTLKHSFSKLIHEGISNEEYALFEVENIEEFFLNKDFNFVNVTIPYKTKCIEFLDELDEVSKKLNVVNTVINKDGKLYGYNTDYYGMRKSMEFHKVDFKDKSVLILGTGASSKTANLVSLDLGAKNIMFASRNKQKDNELTYDEIYGYNFDIIINTTPVGMYPNIEDKVLIDFNKMKSVSVVCDLVYNPLYTNLLIEAKKHNIKIINGLYMLVAQAYMSESLYLNKIFTDEEIFNTYLSLYFKQMNIVLIGMPYSGKSTISRCLSSVYNKDVYDTDLIIEEKENIKISEIFKVFGEEKFRELEQNLVDEIYFKNDIIISTGGGMVLNNNVMKKLKNNGIIIYIKRDIEDVCGNLDDSRPLIKNIDDYKNLYQKRNELYLKYQDITVLNNKNIGEVLKEIEVKIYEYLCN